MTHPVSIVCKYGEKKKRVIFKVFDTDLIYFEQMKNTGYLVSECFFSICVQV